MTKLRLACVLAAAAATAGCAGNPLGGLWPGSAPEQQASGGSALQNLAMLGTTSPPPPASATISPDDIDCPPVNIAAGGAAIRLGGQTTESVRTQVTITEVARECAPTPDGGLVVRVGAAGRVLVGPAGSAGAHFASLRIEVRRNDALLSSRSVRVGASIPAGQGGADWAHVEQGVAIPASAVLARGDVDIVVTLNPGAAQPRRARR